MSCPLWQLCAHGTRLGTQSHWGGQSPLGQFSLHSQPPRLLLCQSKAGPNRLGVPSTKQAPSHHHTTTPSHHHMRWFRPLELEGMSVTNDCFWYKLTGSNDCTSSTSGAWYEMFAWAWTSFEACS
eukprot:m.142688 g.142688  ORF g.142688 m.142688 type:complete len:125 (+) comp17144_c0_seq9:1229-1603(+)